jgi:uncharacterized membrane protein (UPF0127 family)
MHKYKTKNLLFIIPILIIFGSAAFYYFIYSIKPINSVTGNNVVINNIAVNVMIADEINEQWQGLSDRQSMGSHNGMLFVFPNKQIQTFVMRRMHYPLDIIWINDNVITKIDKRLEPEGSIPVGRYSSDEPVNRVLEVQGGFTDAFNIKVGDKVKYNLE